MKFFKLKELYLLAGLLILLAARPWRTTNEVLGLVPPQTEEVAGLSQDSLLMQPVNIVLPPSAVDSLEKRIALKDSIKAISKARLKDADKEIASLEKKLNEKKKILQKQQENLVSLEEIYDLADKQANRGKEYP